MRLTTIDKNAFVRAVLDDVPQVDYEDQARKLVQQAVYEAMPSELRVVYDNKELRSFLNTGHVFTPIGFPHFFLCGGALLEHHKLRDNRPDIWEQLEELGAKNIAQNNAYNQLRQKLYALINQATTLKKAKQLLPEFIKYLPADRDAQLNKNLPVTTTILSDLTAAGWPKDKPLAA